MDIQDHLIFYIAFFTGSFLFSFLINGLFLRFASSLGIRNHDSNDTIVRWGSTSKPAFGGISFYISFLVSTSLFAIFFDHKIEQEFLGLLAASSLGFIVGLADDAFNTRPLLKFLGQVMCGVILILTNNVIDLFDIELLNYLFTLFWVIGLMNSINMLDNMDAITTSISLTIICSALFMILLQKEYDSIYLLVLMGVASSLFGFLYYNWHPSKMYMGDTGSQFLGVFLACIGINYFWNFEDVNENVIFSKQALTAILVFIMPIIDTTTVVINRLRRGQSPFVGGKDHTTHCLSYLGFSDRHVAFTFAGISLLSLVFVFYIYKYVTNWSYIHIISILGYCLTLFIIFYAISRKFEFKHAVKKEE